MNEITKTIKYRNKEYVVKYNFTIEKGLDGKTSHNIYILNTNTDTPQIIYRHSYVSNNNNQVSIIGLCKEAIDIYEFSIRSQFLYLDEFSNWNGNLDDWNE